jgi:hypothetical protein
MGQHVWPVLDAAFREFGLPLRLRSDNVRRSPRSAWEGCRALRFE